MGMEFSVYIGCAITINKMPTIKTQKTKRICSSNNKHRISNGNFCSICGNSIVDKNYTLEENINLYELLEEGDLCNKFNYVDDCLIVNSNKYCLHIDEYESVEKDLDLSLFDLDKFKIYSKDLIELLDNNNIEYKISNIVKTIWT